MTFDQPPEERYFEDYVPGAVHEFGFISVDEGEVIEFGKRYVPLSYHIDKQAAQKEHLRRSDRQWLANRGT